MSQHIKHGCDHIFFIGFLGAGKSTLARNVGTMFKRRFIDTDRLVVRRCGKSVTEIFETEGEDRFRELETSALRSLQSERSLLVSCGGGIVETPVNIELMHKMGTCVYLEGDFEDSLRQIRRSDTRPDFRSPEHAARLFEHRRPLYRQAADITLDIRNKSFEDVSYPLCRDAFWSVDCYDSPSTYQVSKTAVSMSASDWARSRSCRACLPRLWANLSGRWWFGTAPHPSAFGEVVEHALVDAGFAVSPLVLEVSPAGATLADADTAFWRPVG